MLGSDPTANLPLQQFIELKQRYGGPLTAANVEKLSLEVRDIAHKGRYVSRSGGNTVCLVALDFDRVHDGIGRIMAVYTLLNRSGEDRKPVEEFLAEYKFFATDCA